MTGTTHDAGGSVARPPGRRTIEERRVQNTAKRREADADLREAFQRGGRHVFRCSARRLSARRPAAAPRGGRMQHATLRSSLGAARAIGSLSACVRE